MEITQITVYKENGSLIARVFEEDGEIKMIVRDIDTSVKNMHRIVHVPFIGTKNRLFSVNATINYNDRKTVAPNIT